MLCCEHHVNAVFRFCSHVLSFNIRLKVTLESVVAQLAVQHGSVLDLRPCAHCSLHCKCVCVWQVAVMLRKQIISSVPLHTNVYSVHFFGLWAESFAFVHCRNSRTMWPMLRALVA